MFQICAQCLYVLHQTDNYQRAITQMSWSVGRARPLSTLSDRAHHTRLTSAAARGPTPPSDLGPPEGFLG